MKAGVYKISNSSNVMLEVLLMQVDQNTFLHNRHINQHLQNAYNKYGRECFEIIETVEITDNIKQDLLDREQFWIDNIKPEYNILLVAGSTLGYHHTEETKRRISKTTTGVKKSAEHSKHISEGLT